MKSLVFFVFHEYSSVLIFVLSVIASQFDIHNNYIDKLNNGFSYKKIFHVKNSPNKCQNHK